MVNDAVAWNATPGTRAFCASIFAGYDAVIVKISPESLPCGIVAPLTAFSRCIVAVLPIVAAWHQMLGPLYSPATPIGSGLVTLMSKSAIDR